MPRRLHPRKSRRDQRGAGCEDAAECGTRCRPFPTPRPAPLPALQEAEGPPVTSRRPVTKPPGTTAAVHFYMLSRRVGVHLRLLGQSS
ncbi:uncharacterized protein LOC123502981 isoform X2 [Portunus trituberculatus]|uniref:uncharacterized protein LOC123502981 isoform X2 n=1 Tax=Portunus trituberculatus TaxID=210409 RepID=UPI001E1D0CCE|nr:uncharacterized protein LOC123502981 isoform X2 [Portunus trituberculatus]